LNFLQSSVCMESKLNEMELDGNSQKKHWTVERYVTFRAYDNYEGFLDSYRRKEPLSMVQVRGLIIVNERQGISELAADDDSAEVLTLACCKVRKSDEGGREASGIHRYLVCKLSCVVDCNSTHLGVMHEVENMDRLPIPLLGMEEPKRVMVHCRKEDIIKHCVQNMILIPVERHVGGELGVYYYCVGDEWQEAEMKSGGRNCSQDIMEWSHYDITKQACDMPEGDEDTAAEAEQGGSSDESKEEEDYTSNSDNDFPLKIGRSNKRKRECGGPSDSESGGDDLSEVGGVLDSDSEDESRNSST
jgi:hypothetical protein